MNHELLKKERMNKGYSQAYMAKSLEFKDRSSYCLIENGKVSIDVETAKNIAKILDLTPKRTLEVFM